MEQKDKKLQEVIDVDEMYGYEQEKEEEKKKSDDWLKLLLHYLHEKKKMYMRPVTP